jgi:hypothetical protein
MKALRRLIAKKRDPVTVNRANKTSGYGWPGSLDGRRECVAEELNVRCLIGLDLPLDRSNLLRQTGDHHFPPDSVVGLDLTHPCGCLVRCSSCLLCPN